MTEKRRKSVFYASGQSARVSKFATGISEKRSGSFQLDEKILEYDKEDSEDSCCDTIGVIHKKREDSRYGIEEDGGTGDVMRADELVRTSRKTSLLDKERDQGCGSEFSSPPQKDKHQSAYQLAIQLLELEDFVVVRDALYWYNSCYGYWQMISADKKSRGFRKCIPRALRSSFNSNSLNETLEWLLIEAPTVDESRVNPMEYLNFRDCAARWRDDAVIIDRKEMYFTYYLDLDFPQEKSSGKSIFKQFIQRQFADDELTKREFYKFLGLALSSVRDKKYAFFLYGPSNTGKSVLMNALQRFVGRAWTAHVSFAQLSEEFAVSAMDGKRLNISGEVSGATNRRGDIFKSLTGNDEIAVRRLYEEYFDFRNECLLVFGCNVFPEFKHNENFQTILERIVIFPFFSAVSRDEDWVDDMDLRLYQDSYHFIRAAIKGLKYLEEDGWRFIDSPKMQELKGDYVKLYNPFLIFAQHYIVSDERSQVPTAQIQEKLDDFCRKQELTSIPSRIWGPILRQNYCVKKVLLTNQGKRNNRGFQGIRLVEDAECSFELEDYEVEDQLDNELVCCEGDDQSFGNFVALERNPDKYWQ